MAYLKKQPNPQKNVSFQLIKRNLWFVLVNKFQLLNSSPSNLCVTSSSMMLATPVLTYSNTSLSSNSLWNVAAEIFFPPSNLAAMEFGDNWEEEGLGSVWGAVLGVLSTSGLRMRLSFLLITLCLEESLWKSVFWACKEQLVLDNWDESVTSGSVLSGEGLNPEIELNKGFIGILGWGCWPY